MEWTTRESNLMKFIYSRLVNVYKENPKIDYMEALRKIVKKIDDAPHTKARLNITGVETRRIKCIEDSGFNCLKVGNWYLAKDFNEDMYTVQIGNDNQQFYKSRFEEEYTMSRKEDFMIKLSEFKPNGIKHCTSYIYRSTDKPDIFFWDKVMEVGKKHGKNTLFVTLFGPEDVELQSCTITPRGARE